MALPGKSRMRGAVALRGRGPVRGHHWLQKLTQEQIVLIVTVILAGIFSAALPGFATISNLFTLLNSISVLGILALGAAVVIIGRGLDISQIASMAVGAAVAAIMMQNGLSIGWALSVGLCVPIVIGLVNGLVIAFIEVPPLFATLATNLLMFGGARVFFIGSNYTIHVPDRAQSFLALGGNLGVIPVPVLVFLGLGVLVHLYLSRTRAGRLIYAHGDNADAARVTGIAIRPLTVFEYVLSALLAYVAGLVLMAMLSSIDTQIVMGTEIFSVILVVVLGGVSLVGGRGSVYSVMAGALLIGVLQSGMTRMNLGSDIQNVVRGIVLMGAIVLDNRLHPRDEETARQGDD